MDTVERMVRHIALGRPAWIRGRFGVYRARCACGPAHFQSPIPGVPKGGRYSFEVRDTIANSLIRDRLPYRKVQERLAEEFALDISVGFVHDCFAWAYGQINTEARRTWAAEHFSGVLCIDEVHDGDRTILYATDPLNDFTVDFEIVETNDQISMDAFLAKLARLGIHPDVVITDGSPLYKDALQEIWEGVEHQLCIFHVIKEVNTLLLDGVRAIKNRLRRQGRKGRKRRRGRPTEAARKRREHRQDRTREEQATFLWENQHLIVRREDKLTREDRETMREMFAIAPQLKLFRTFNQEFYRLFERGITQQQARNRRTRMENNAAYQSHYFLRKALKKIRRQRFEKMIVFLKHGDDAQRTSNHVERNNRSFRMLQKTRYKRRQERTIRMAIELDLYARMLRHALFKSHPGIPLAMLQNSNPVAA